MIIKTIKRFLVLFRRDHDAFLKNATGVIHIGANEGQERAQYHSLKLPVIWIEPIPAVFEKLKYNINAYRDQSAFNYLVTDKDDEVYSFNVANNQGASSSILPLSRHSEIWPDVSFTAVIPIKSITLESFMRIHDLSAEKYNALILDTQGSELLILKGASSILAGFAYVKLEVPDFEAYAGCCKIGEVIDFMKNAEFREIGRDRFAGGRSGSYYNIVFANKKMGGR